MPKQPTYSIERFKRIVEPLPFISTDGAVMKLDDAKYWIKDDIEYQVLNYKRTVVRRLIGQMYDADGKRQMLSLFVTDEETGQKIRVYKSREKMTVGEYKQAIAFYVGWGMKGIATARALARECKQVHGIQPRLPGLF